MGHAANRIEGYQLPTFAVLAARLLESRRGFRSLSLIEQRSNASIKFVVSASKTVKQAQRISDFLKARDEAGLTYLEYI